MEEESWQLLRSFGLRVECSEIIIMWGCFTLKAVFVLLCLIMKTTENINVLKWL